ncbi:Zonadhesin [Manis pentadactyla]|nr:Zonadhesin [Manis pentadactyla]
MPSPSRAVSDYTPLHRRLGAGTLALSAQSSGEPAHALPTSERVGLTSVHHRRHPLGTHHFANLETGLDLTEKFTLEQGYSDVSAPAAVRKGKRVAVMTLQVILPVAVNTTLTGISPLCSSISWDGL